MGVEKRVQLLSIIAHTISITAKVRVHLFGCARKSRAREQEKATTMGKCVRRERERKIKYTPLIRNEMTIVWCWLTVGVCGGMSDGGVKRELAVFGL